MTSCPEAYVCPFRFSDLSGPGRSPQLRVDVHVVGQGPFPFRLEPGLPRSSISSALARQLALAPRSTELWRYPHGTIQVALLHPTLIRISQAPEARLPLAIVPDARRAAANLDAELEGLLGFDYLRAFALRYRFADGLLELTPPGRGLHRTLGAIPIELGPPRRPSVLVPVQLNGHPASVFVLDPSAPATLVHPHCAAVCGLDNSIGGGGAAIGADGASPVWFGRARELRCSDIIRQGITVAIGPAVQHAADALGRRLDGILGQDLLRHTVLEIDHQDQILHWSTSAPP